MLRSLGSLDKLSLYLIYISSYLKLLGNLSNSSDSMIKISLENITNTKEKLRLKNSKYQFITTKGKEKIYYETFSEEIDALQDRIVEFEFEFD
ncbi:MAG: hypothetical protein GY830_09660 [Bacteroidetes bacterium]|nr:hypothetical protein [Bacteroidota bacterium]